MQGITQGNQSTLLQGEINVLEGESIDLNIYFLQYGPSNTDYYTFTITTGGSAMGMKNQ